MERAIYLTAVIAVLQLLAPQAHAVVLGLEDTVPTGEWSGMYPNFVGQYGAGSAVAISDHWLLTVRHYSPADSVLLDGSYYDVTETLTAPTPPGQTLPPDLRLVHVEQTLPGWYDLCSDSVSSLVGEDVILVGTGHTGTSLDSYYQWDNTTPRMVRWGTNRIERTDFMSVSGKYASHVVEIEFREGDTEFEAGLADHDSGAGLFVQRTDNHGRVRWELAALGAYVDGTVYTDNNWAVAVAPYIDWIRDQSPLPPLLGDADLDGDVDSADLSAIAQNWSPSSEDKTWAEGDFDGDGDVDSADLASLGMHWSPGGWHLPTQTVVPEPTSLGLFGLLGVAMLRRRK
jgi:hypothetical protein